MIISKTLKNLGVTPAWLGYDYLECAIKLTMENKTVVHSITKTLYPELAKKFKTKSTRVERCIRHAVEAGWLRADVDLQVELFGYSLSTTRYKPTNAEFIATVADYLLRLQNEDKDK